MYIFSEEQDTTLITKSLHNTQGLFGKEENAANTYQAVRRNSAYLRYNILVYSYNNNFAKPNIRCDGTS
jgi:hypothetical protein